jgi:pyruvate formate lyase activating enzyme
LDTSGLLFNRANTDKIDELLKYTSLVMLDIKHIDDEEHKKLTMHSNKAILDFAKYLSEKNIPTWIRHVVVPGITYNEEYLVRLGEFLAGLKNIKALDVLPYHDMAVPKYENLGLKYPLEGIPPLTHDEALNARNILFRRLKRQEVYNSKKNLEKTIKLLYKRDCNTIMEYVRR